MRRGHNQNLSLLHRSSRGWTWGRSQQSRHTLEEKQELETQPLMALQDPAKKETERGLAHTLFTIDELDLLDGDLIHERRQDLPEG